MSSLALFRIWFLIGIQSFGGGATTTLLIRRNAVHIHGWVTDEEFNRDWALCQVTPGINLLALTTLIGKQIAGARGIAICLAGLLLPSAVLTAVLTAGFLLIRDLPSVKGALNGIVPATVGLGLVTACQMANPPLRESSRRGIWHLSFAILLLVGSAILFWTGVISVTAVLLAAGFVGAVEGYLVTKFYPRKEDREQ